MESDVTNADRAWWALFALGDFINRTRVDSSDDAIADLITDLLHLARAANLDPAALSARALAGMEEEIAEDNEGDMAPVAEALEAMMIQSMALAFPWRR